MQKAPTGDKEGADRMKASLRGDGENRPVQCKVHFGEPRQGKVGKRGAQILAHGVIRDGALLWK